MFLVIFIVLKAQQTIHIFDYDTHLIEYSLPVLIKNIIIFGLVKKKLFL